MSSSKKRQTMAKIARERAVRERRERKQEKKDERKQAAAAAREAGDETFEQDPGLDEPREA